MVLFGNPGILIALILFGGSIFVFAMLQIIHIVTRRIRESGKIKLDEEPEDLIAVMDEIRDMFTVQMQQKEMDYSVITDSVQDRFAVCDKTLIERIMLNLISNAYKYTEEGEGGRHERSYIKADRPGRDADSTFRHRQIVK